jgi:colanic acid biosynthesis protein WcaH
MSEWIPDHDWATIVANVPIVSVDLLVRYDGGLILGKRTNEPAKGYWFMPGGRVHKNETRSEAVHRIGNDELGLDIEIVESLGAFEHLYGTSDVSSIDTKHYLANGYVVDVVDREPQPDDQHETLRVFRSAPDPLHEYLQAYLETAETLVDWP